MHIYKLEADNAQDLHYPQPSHQNPSMANELNVSGLGESSKFSSKRQKKYNGWQYGIPAQPERLTSQPRASALKRIAPSSSNVTNESRHSLAEPQLQLTGGQSKARRNIKGNYSDSESEEISDWQEHKPNVKRQCHSAMLPRAPDTATDSEDLDESSDEADVSSSKSAASITSAQSESDESDSHSDRSSDEEASGSNAEIGQVIYFRTQSQRSDDVAELQQLLRAEYPDATVIVDAAPSKAPFHHRNGLKELFQLIATGRVKKLLIESATQVCNTKEAFSLFDWMCQFLGTEIHIVPSLHRQ